MNMTICRKSLAINTFKHLTMICCLALVPHTMNILGFSTLWRQTVNNGKQKSNRCLFFSSWIFQRFTCYIMTHWRYCQESIVSLLERYVQLIKSLPLSFYCHSPSISDSFSLTVPFLFSYIKGKKVYCYVFTSAYMGS